MEKEIINHSASEKSYDSEFSKSNILNNLMNFALEDCDMDNEVNSDYEKKVIDERKKLMLLGNLNTEVALEVENPKIDAVKEEVITKPKLKLPVKKEKELKAYSNNIDNRFMGIPNISPVTSNHSSQVNQPIINYNNYGSSGVNTSYNPYEVMTNSFNTNFNSLHNQSFGNTNNNIHGINQNMLYGSNFNQNPPQINPNFYQDYSNIGFVNSPRQNDNFSSQSINPQFNNFSQVVMPNTNQPLINNNVNYNFQNSNCNPIYNNQLNEQNFNLINSNFNHSPVQKNYKIPISIKSSPKAINLSLNNSPRIVSDSGSPMYYSNNSSSQQILNQVPINLLNNFGHSNSNLTTTNYQSNINSHNQFQMQFNNNNIQQFQQSNSSRLSGQENILASTGEGGKKMSKLLKSNTLKIGNQQEFYKNNSNKNSSSKLELKQPNLNRSPNRCGPNFQNKPKNEFIKKSKTNYIDQCIPDPYSNIEIKITNYDELDCPDKKEQKKYGETTFSSSKDICSTNTGDFINSNRTSNTNNKNEDSYKRSKKSSKDTNLINKSQHLEIVSKEKAKKNSGVSPRSHKSGHSGNTQSSKGSIAYNDDYLKSESQRIPKIIKDRQVLNSSLTKNGSKLFQYFIPLANDTEMNEIFEQLVENVEILIRNPYGNYVFQKLVENIDYTKRIQIYDAIKFNIYTLCVHSLGNRSIQILIQKSSSKFGLNPVDLDLVNENLSKSELANKLQMERRKLIKLINPLINDLSFNKYGCFVLEQMLTSYEDHEVGELQDYIFNEVVDIITNENGVCLFKKFIEVTKAKSLSYKLDLCDKLTQNLQLIFKDKFGHYGLIFLAEQWGVDCCKSLIDYILNKISIYGMLSYSHKFLRKVFYFGDINYKKYIVTNIENKISNFNKFLSYKVGSKTFKLILVYHKEVLNLEMYNEFFKDLINNPKFNNKSIEIIMELDSLCNKNNEGGRKNSDDY